MNIPLMLLVAIVFLQVFTTIKLIETRHELRQATGEIRLHDEMIEGIGDDLTRSELTRNR